MLDDMQAPLAWTFESDHPRTNPMQPTPCDAVRRQLLVGTAVLLAAPALRAAVTRVGVWTDDFHNLLAVFKWR